jgi:hypothetical protein
VSTGTGQADPVVRGALRFARYAYPPNELGYCGPDASAQLLEQVAAAAADGGLRHLLQAFEGAWPYLELIAAANGVRDPLDDRVVEAYWVGNDLLDHVGVRLLGASLEDRFRRRAGRTWEHLVAPVPLGALPHHSFHVLGVYPWLGLLRGGQVDEPLRVLDRCRVRWGRVCSVATGRAVVRSRPLVWDGRHLGLGDATEEEVLASVDGRGLAPAVRPGAWCALHWDWICEELDPASVTRLRHYTLRQLAAVDRTRVPAPARLLS